MFCHAIASGRITEGTQVITAGAIAVAAAHFATRLGLPSTAIVPTRTPPGVLARIEAAGGRWQHAEGPPAGLQKEAAALADSWGGHFLDPEWLRAKGIDPTPYERGLTAWEGLGR